MKKIAFVTLYDNICLGNRILSSIAKGLGFETHLITFKDQKTRAIRKDSKDHLSYQFYVGGVKYGSCYAAYDYTPKEAELLIELLEKLDPDLICLSTRSFGYRALKEIISPARARLRGIVIGGGWGPTLEPERFLEFCDYVCFGEGEQAITEICGLIEAGETDLSGVQNLMRLDQGRLVRNPVARPLTEAELDELPFADFEESNKYLIEEDRIVTGHETVNRTIYNCLAGRGCPLNCTYCMSSKYKALYATQGFNIPKYRLRSPERVIEELKRAKANGATYVRISDEIFPIWKKWIDAFIPLYKEHIDLPFFAYIRPEFHNDETLRRLIDIGLTSSVVAIQSGADEIRRKVYKRLLPKDRIKKFADTLSRYGIEYTYHLINFNPFEREEHLEETLGLLMTLPYSTLILFKLVPFPGTPISRMIAEQKPVMLPDSIQKWYGYLYAMAVTSPLYRRMAGFIHERGLFRGNPWPLALLFVPNYVKIHYQKLKRKLLYGTSTLLPIPTRKLARTH